MHDSPEVYLVLEAMKKIGVDLFLDLHSDEIIPEPLRYATNDNLAY